MKKCLKVNNASDFWYFNDENDYGIWDFISVENIDYSKYYSFFFNTYYKLTHKYRILIPYYDAVNNSFEKGDILNLLERKNPNKLFGLADLYNRVTALGERGEMIFPTELFLSKNNTIYLDKVTNIHPLKNINNDLCVGNEPVRFPNLNPTTKKMLPLSRIKVCTDAFFTELTNGNIHNNDLYAEKHNSLNQDSISCINNSELAYLNTTRFNSFLRDLKKLNFFCGAEFSYEGWPDFTSKDGFFLDGEIIYYEDIYDLLPEQLKVKQYEEIKIEIDENSYQKFCNPMS